MKLGLALEYAAPRLEIPVELVREAERLGFHSVWSAEAYGSDAHFVIAFNNLNHPPNVDEIAQTCGTPPEHIHIGQGKAADVIRDQDLGSLLVRVVDDGSRAPVVGARVRVLDSTRSQKNDANDARSVAIAVNVKGVPSSTVRRAIGSMTGATFVSVTVIVTVAVPVAGVGAGSAGAGSGAG